MIRHTTSDFMYKLYNYIIHIIPFAIRTLYCLVVRCSPQRWDHYGFVSDGKLLWYIPHTFFLDRCEGYGLKPKSNTAALYPCEPCPVAQKPDPSFTGTCVACQAGDPAPCGRLDSFTVYLHRPNGRHLPAVRSVQGDYRWPNLKRWKFSPVTWAHNLLCLRYSQPVFRPASHRGVMPANWRQCLRPNWQSYCHQTRTVKQSNIYKYIYIYACAHDDVMVWKKSCTTGPLREVTGVSPHEGSVMRIFDVFLCFINY